MRNATWRLLLAYRRLNNGVRIYCSISYVNSLCVLLQLRAAFW
jgi:hypothetical protein